LPVPATVETVSCDAVNAVAANKKKEITADEAASLIDPATGIKQTLPKNCRGGHTPGAAVAPPPRPHRQRLGCGVGSA